MNIVVEEVMNDYLTRLDHQANDAIGAGDRGEMNEEKKDVVFDNLSFSKPSSHIACKYGQHKQKGDRFRVTSQHNTDEDD